MAKAWLPIRWRWVAPGTDGSTICRDADGSASRSPSARSENGSTILAPSDDRFADRAPANDCSAGLAPGKDRSAAGAAAYKRSRTGIRRCPAEGFVPLAAADAVHTARVLA